jgi:outer membrane immunogenic protein
MQHCAGLWGTVMKRLLLSSLGAVALAFCSAPPQASAADMAVKAPAADNYSWTGCYVGGNFGTIFTKADWTLPGAALSSMDTNALAFGGQAGCNYQISTWVFGVQGDYDFVNLSGANDGSATGVDAVNAGVTDRSTVDSIASLTGRFGYAWWRILFYAKGGGAWQRDKYDMLLTGTTTSFSPTTVTRSGFTVGGGIEYAITDHFNMFFEYDFYDFGTSTSTFVVPPVESVGIRETDSIVKVGVNWKF